MTPTYPGLGDSVLRPQDWLGCGLLVTPRELTNGGEPKLILVLHYLWSKDCWAVLSGKQAKPAVLNGKQARLLLKVSWTVLTGKQVMN